MTRRETFDNVSYCRYSAMMSFGLHDVEISSHFRHLADTRGRFINVILLIVQGEKPRSFILLMGPYLPAVMNYCISI